MLFVFLPHGSAIEKSDLDQLKKKRLQIQSDLNTTKKTRDDLKKKESKIVQDIDLINRRLNAVSKKLKRMSKTISLREQEIALLKEESIALSEKIRVSKQEAEKRLSALYKYSRIGRFSILASSSSLTNYLMKRNFLSRIVAGDFARLERIKKDRQKVELLQKKLRVTQERKQIESSDYRKTLVGYNAQRKKKQALLQTIEKNKSKSEKLLTELVNISNELDTKIKNLENQFVENGKKDESEQFSVSRGLLKMPVTGKILNKYGPYKNKEFNVMNFRSGIDILAVRGEPIRTVSSGYVIFSNWFKGYGNMIIIDHGSGYYTLYANVEELLKKKGDRVNTGEVIATAGNTGSMNFSGLHFEVRHHGKPLNPLQWLNVKG